MAQNNHMLGAMLRVPFQAIVDNIYSALLEAGYSDLRPPYFVVFQHMKPGGVRAINLAEKAQITKQSISYLVNYMEEHGYVEKIADQSDGRAQLIRLTDKGRDVERIARDAITQTQLEWRGIIGEEKMNELIATLTSLVGYIETERRE